MANFCSNCATALDADARFCPSCRASVGVASALASELTGSLKASVKNLVVEASQSVPPFIWAASLQIYWLLTGIGQMLAGGVLVGVSAGVIGGSGALASGLLSGGAAVERALLVFTFMFLGGAVDTCLSSVLVFGFLTLKKWVRGVFMVWLPVRVTLAVLGYFAAPTLGKSEGTTPFVVIFVIGLLVILHITALIVEFGLVKRGVATLAQE